MIFGHESSHSTQLPGTKTVYTTLAIDILLTEASCFAELNQSGTELPESSLASC